MIERKFVAENIKEFEIQEYISQTLRNVGHSHTKLQRTPLGEKIIIFASRPGLVVGRKGENIKKLTKTLKTRFKLENPYIEISEVNQFYLDAQIVAERIASSLEQYGTSKFKAIGHKTMSEVIKSGARGVEIIISGKIPGARAKSWRFYEGYLKKSGDIAIENVKSAYAVARLKTGIIGIKVKIMPPDIDLPDTLEFKSEEKQIDEEKQEIEKQETKKTQKKETKEKKIERKKEAKTDKKETKKVETSKSNQKKQSKEKEDKK